jgi:hypothetical protein
MAANLVTARTPAELTALYVTPVSAEAAARLARLGEVVRVVG